MEPVPKFSRRTKSVKKAANVSIDNELLRQAKDYNINLSRTLEERLVELLRKRRRDEWLKKNRPALEAYNRTVEQEGVFSDGVRGF
jgi:antitoxin CcdA